MKAKVKLAKQSSVKAKVKSIQLKSNTFYFIYLHSFLTIKTNQILNNARLVLLISPIFIILFNNFYDYIFLITMNSVIIGYLLCLRISLLIYFYSYNNSEGRSLITLYDSGDRRKKLCYNKFKYLKSIIYSVSKMSLLILFSIIIFYIFIKFLIYFNVLQTVYCCNGANINNNATNTIVNSLTVTEFQESSISALEKQNKFIESADRAWKLENYVNNTNYKPGSSAIIHNFKSPFLGKKGAVTAQIQLASQLEKINKSFPILATNYNNSTISSSGSFGQEELTLSRVPSPIDETAIKLILDEITSL